MKRFIESFGFGVCSFLGEKMGINASRIRLYFIYTSFVALGSPIIFYLFTAFWINIKKYFREDSTTLA
jgi:phage shock protein PspC (stress-responsive transcriptional regulator)